MLNSVYRLVTPRAFEPVQVDIPLQEDTVLVRPTHLSICNADQRYYQGRRPAEVLQQKLPMALIHEGIGVVTYSGATDVPVGQRVVMLPNAPVEQDCCIAENYLRSSKFCGSGFDGMMQEYMALPSSRVMALPDWIDNNIAAFTEIVSVAVHAISRMETIAHNKRNSFGVWGDGNLGYIVAVLLHALYPDTDLYVIGRNQHKLNEFTFVNGVFLSYDIKYLPAIDHAFECCGREGSTSAIAQIIDHINPEGSISLLGVSEDPVPINTRMVLEKGLRLFGSSRSGWEDFERTIALYEQYPKVVSYLNTLVGDVIPVSTVLGMTDAFEADIHKNMGKTIMAWNL